MSKPTFHNTSCIFLGIFPMNFAMATLGLKEMGKFPWESKEKSLPSWQSKFSFAKLDKTANRAELFLKIILPFPSNLISLLRSYKKIKNSRYFPHANFGLFFSLVQFFGQNITNKNHTNEINSQKIALPKYLANATFLQTQKLH